MRKFYKITSAKIGMSNNSFFKKFHHCHFKKIQLVTKIMLSPELIRDQKNINSIPGKSIEIGKKFIL
jgi:hypothetical protein